MISTLPDLWLPQTRALADTTAAIADGEQRICLTLPTGGGKSRIACELIRDWLHVGYKVSVYTNRKMLLDQLSRVVSEFGLNHGIRNATVPLDKLPCDSPLQVSSIQTEASRVLKKKVWQLHAADRVLIDEAHLQTGNTARQIIDLHIAQGAAVVGLTATPLDLWDIYTHLVVGGTNSELRDCGALVTAKHYGCEEPDTKRIKKSTVEMTENDVKKVFNVQHVIGHIFNRYDELNPDRLPSIGFAPGVAESIWLADEFRKRGIEAAHIDGEACMYEGKRYDSDPDIRREVMRAWRAGEVKIVWNRFVLREGIDAPFIEHMVLATILSSLQSYLQSVGRGLRASPSTGKTHLTIQDHGGHWWRHGSVNANRQWEVGLTERIVAGMREEKLRNKTEREPLRCPKCGLVVLGTKCACGFEIASRTRPVIMETGEIKEHTGEIFTRRHERHAPNTQDLWEAMYYRSKAYKKGRTFRAAMGLFAHENGYYPPRNLHLMPKDERDLFRLVKDVPRENLL
jgi:superfamily II DNA or RNA helicase